MSKRVKVSDIKMNVPSGGAFKQHTFPVYYTSGLGFEASTPKALQTLYGLPPSYLGASENELNRVLEKARKEVVREATSFKKVIAVKVVTDVHFQKTKHNLGFEWHVLYERVVGNVKGYYTLAPRLPWHNEDSPELEDPDDPFQLTVQELEERLDYKPVEGFSIVEWTPERALIASRLEAMFVHLKEQLTQNFGSPKATRLLLDGATSLLLPAHEPDA